MVKENIEQAKNEFSAPLLPILDLNEESNMVSKEVDFFGSSSQSSNILDVNYDRENVDNLFFSVGDTQSFSTTQLTTNQVNVVPTPGCPYTIDDFHIFYPDTRRGKLEGFHSTALADPRRDYYWVTPPGPNSDRNPFSARFGIPGQPQFGTKVSSFFPTNLFENQVLDLIGEAYIKSGCNPTGDWSAVVTNPETTQPMTIAMTTVNYEIRSAFPLV